MTRETQILTRLEVKGCRAELYLNDVPVMMLRPDSQGLQLIASEQLVVPGRNRIELLVEPGPTPQAARSGARNLERDQICPPVVTLAEPIGPPGPRAAAKLVQGVIEDTPTIADPDVLIEARWEWPAEVTQGVLTFPQSVIAEIELPGRGRWRWQDAPQLELDDGLRAEALAFLDDFETAFRAGRLDVLWELSRQQTEDVQRCYSGLTEEFLKGDLARVVDFYRRSSVPVLPRDPERMDFRLAARGRLLHVVDKGWEPALKLKDPDDGLEVGVPMFLARVEGALRIVR